MSVQSTSVYMLYASTTTEDYEVSSVNINVLLAMQHGLSTLIHGRKRKQCSLMSSYFLQQNVQSCNLYPRGWTLTFKVTIHRTDLPQSMHGQQSRTDHWQTCHRVCMDCSLGQATDRPATEYGGLQSRTDHWQTCHRVCIDSNLGQITDRPATEYAWTAI